MLPIPARRAAALLVWAACALVVPAGCRGPERFAPPAERVTHAAASTTAEEIPVAAAGSPAREGETPGSLRDYRVYALRNNPGLRALYHEWQAQAARAPQARSLPEPRLSYTEYLREVETRVGPQERSFMLSQSFPWFGKLGLRGSIEEKAAQEARQRFLAAQLVVDQELRTTYAEYYYLARSVAITRETLSLLDRLERVARQKLAAGAGNHADIIRLQVEIGRLEDRLKTFLDMRRPLAAKLNAILNRRSDAEIPWPTTLERGRFEVPDEEILRFVEENNPDLVALQHEIERSALARDLAGKAYFPDFSLGVSTIVTGGALAPGVRGSGEDPWLLTFSVELPIWYSKYRAGERETEERWHAARRKHADRRSRLAADVELALYKLRDAERRVSLHEETLIPKAEESLTATEAAFQADTASFLDLIDSERVLLEFQLARERALADTLRAQSEIDRLLGRHILQTSETTMETSP